MAERDSIQRPVQVFLDTRRFIHPPAPGTRGPSRDFFQGDNEGFRRHKAKMREQLRASSLRLREQHSALGFVLVQIREDALAKSYRPIEKLFCERNQFALVGGRGIGEMFFQATPDALDALDTVIAQRAEDVPQERENPRTGEFEERVSGYRSELGAIASIGLLEAPDRLDFSASEAVTALEKEGVIGGYLVELFRPDPAVSGDAVRAQLEALQHRLTSVGSLFVRPVAGLRERRPTGLTLSIDLLPAGAPNDIVLLAPEGPAAATERTAGRAVASAPRDRSVKRHQLLLEQLAEEPLVRRIALPMEIEPAPTGVSEPGAAIDLPAPLADRDYPVVGVIDGGISALDALDPWCAGVASPLLPGDSDHEHGTFIAGLVAAGSALNPGFADRLEREPCRYFDLAIMPRKPLLGQYYSTPDEFFDQLEELVVHAKAEAGTRVFNFSLGSPNGRTRHSYSTFASRLDEIARIHDVIFVVSAGNLDGAQRRPEWPVETDKALEMLAQRGARDDGITAPAEHMFGLSVGAVNPPGLTTAVDGLPTAYTRRGPGAGGARKPELVHYGGAAQRTGNDTGLASLDADGSVVKKSGTSFAAPLVAATVAALDHRLGGQVSRELLMALPVHRSTRHPAMMKKPLRPIAREFVGFGVPGDSEACLADDPHSITLVFADVLPAKRELSFVFTWPSSLTGSDGKCRGAVDITLAYSPVVDSAFDAECQRVQLAATLHQLNETITDEGEIIPNHTSQLKHYDNELPQNLDYTEKYLLESGLKWTPIKRYFREMRGVGNRSDWRLSLSALTRAGAIIPDEGIGFALLMTISDPKGVAPVYDEVRAEVLRRGLRLADITAQARIRV